jgi:hypothetical protein
MPEREKLNYYWIRTPHRLILVVLTENLRGLAEQVYHTSNFNNTFLGFQ